MNKRRVVITGIGVVAPNGVGKKAFWQGLKTGKNCVDRISLFDPENLPSQVSAEIKNFEPSDFVAKHLLHTFHRVVPMAIAATEEAIREAKLLKTKYLKNIGVLIGTGAGGLGYGEEQIKKLYQSGIKKMSPHSTTGTFVGMLSSDISINFGFKGRSQVVSTGCTSANDATSYAYDCIRFGLADILVSGGAESAITPAIVGAFCRLGALSTSFNATPNKASRPFNKDRDGFVMGEGAWIYILEELNHALKRGVKIYGEIVGHAATCDAYHKTAPEPNGTELIRAIELALKEANLPKNKVDYINLHGTSTVLNDKIETLAIKKCFGKRAKSIPTSSFKSMLGHPQGASGACGVAGTLLAMENNIIPPTINYTLPDEECDLDYVPNESRHAKLNNCVIDSIGFGSKNSIIVLQKHNN